MPKEPKEPEMKKIAVEDVTAGIENLRDAITDLASEAQKGGAITDAIIGEVAQDYGLNPALLKRKFEEQYPKGVGGRLPTMQENVKRKVDELVADYIKNYGINPDRVVDFKHKNGSVYTAIAQIGRGKILAVSHKDGIGYNVRPENVEKVLFKPGQDPHMNQVPESAS